MAPDPRLAGRARAHEARPMVRIRRPGDRPGVPPRRASPPCSTWGASDIRRAFEARRRAASDTWGKRPHGRTRRPRRDAARRAEEGLAETKRFDGKWQQRDGPSPSPSSREFAVRARARAAAPSSRSSRRICGPGPSTRMRRERIRVRARSTADRPANIAYTGCGTGCSGAHLHRARPFNAGEPDFAAGSRGGNRGRALSLVQPEARLGNPARFGIGDRARACRVALRWTGRPATTSRSLPGDAAWRRSCRRSLPGGNSSRHSTFCA